MADRSESRGLRGCVEIGRFTTVVVVVTVITGRRMIAVIVIKCKSKKKLVEPTQLSFVPSPLSRAEIF